MNIHFLEHAWSGTALSGKKTTLIPHLYPDRITGYAATARTIELLTRSLTYAFEFVKNNFYFILRPARQSDEKG